ncbi:MAG TPA: pyrroline-5-carboxylate reductase [Xanthobacteraceae bacterium]|jgi:pyrroline-5-carboxylate reductase|nr:pyrroline-5-carboxylate reductase [Xanthobacteraceae bacterium]
MTTTAAGSLRDFAGTIVLVGAGKMGSAMLDGWLGLGLAPARVAVIEPEPSPEIAALAARGLKLNPDRHAVRDPAVIVIAVKPQVAGEVVPATASWVGPSSVVVSIMAGQRLASLERALPGGTAVVRSMPNTPAAVGRGITVAVANPQVTAPQRDLAGRLLAAIGAVEWVADEAMLDAVTAVSGSGPAYVFLLAETLAQAGAAAGLPPDLAGRLARATVAGSGELLYRSTLDAETLRRNVMSPGGTTVAALEVLMDKDGLAPLMRRAVAAATRRSRELAG